MCNVKLIKKICIAFLFVYIYFIFLLYESEFQCFMFSTLCLKLFALYQFDNKRKLQPQVRLTQITFKVFRRFRPALYIWRSGKINLT